MKDRYNNNFEVFSNFYLSEQGEQSIKWHKYKNRYRPAKVLENPANLHEQRILGNFFIKNNIFLFYEIGY